MRDGAGLDLLQHFTSVTRTMLEDLECLVREESPTSDHEALARSADVVADLGDGLLGSRPEQIVSGGATHLRWRLGEEEPGILLLGHHDTVWPMGTLDRLPWSVADGVARGPGCFDMKAGLVMMLHALAVQDDLDGVTVLVSGDEEIGSPGAYELIAEEAERTTAVLVAEPSADRGALKTGRSGVTHYELTVKGRAAHAGLEPHHGRNAAVEAAHQLLQVAEAAERLEGVTAVPTVVDAGVTANTVPAEARVVFDTRPQTIAAQHRLDEMFESLTPRTDGTTLSWQRSLRVPPMEPSASRDLFSLAGRLVKRHGLPSVTSTRVGGASDGNRTAALGVPTLDGLGAVGGGAHGDDEHVDVGRIADRTALLAALVAELRSVPVAAWRSETP